MEAFSPLLPHVRQPDRPRHLALFGDERLARLVAAGNERAFAALYERYHQPLYRYCRSILRDETDAQDALQSAFLGAFAALRDRRRDAPIRPWLFRIAHNEAISIIRRQRRDAEEQLTDASGSPRAADSAEDQAAQRAQLGLLMSDLRELPERQRAALVMRELSGLSHDEIALALETSPATAKQAIFEARQALLEFAEGRTMACDDVRQAISEGDRRTLRGRRVRAHMRDCTACAAFAAAIPARSAELRAMAPPLAPLAAAGLLARITGAGSVSAGGSGGAGGIAAAGIGKLTTASLATKTLVGVAVVAATAAGVTTTLHRSRATQQPPAAPVPAIAAGHHSTASAGASRVTPSAATAGHKARGASASASHASLRPKHSSSGHLTASSHRSNASGGAAGGARSHSNPSLPRGNGSAVRTRPQHSNGGASGSTPLGQRGRSAGAIHGRGSSQARGQSTPKLASGSPPSASAGGSANGSRHRATAGTHHIPVGG